MKYRAEIDGLRALAVIPVILFHAGLEVFSGGFIGVDVFFVISGYLITTILIEDMENKRFSIVGFYERRARRILPALFFVMLVCIPFSFLWMSSSQMKDFFQSLVAVSLFVSNFLFWKESGYFDTSSENKPLLHTWSLAVEEQYYLLFPVFLLFAWRFGKNKVFLTIMVMAVVSLLLSEWGWRNKESANFYLAHTRAWELLVGSMAAFIVRNNGVKSNGFLASLGLIAIIFSIFFYDESTPFPSVYALIPVVGVVLLVLYADKDTLPARLLSTRLFVSVGLISYSAYLWHQPLLAFARIEQQNQTNLTFLGMPNDLGALKIALLIVATFGLAYISWKFVEKPFRRKGDYTSNFFNKWYVRSFLGLFFFIIIGLIGNVYIDDSSNYAKNDIELSDSWSVDVRRSRCLLQKPSERSHAQECLNSSADVVLWGDSHAASLSPGLGKELEAKNVAFSQLTQSGCAPLNDIKTLKYRYNCNFVNSDVLQAVIESKFNNVVLHAAWLHEHYPMSSSDVVDKLESIIDAVQSNIPNVNIVVVGAVPRWRKNPNYHEIVSEDDKFIYSDSMFILSNMNLLLSELAIKRHVSFVDPVKVFCNKFESRGECILAIKDAASENGVGVTIDYGHLSTEASYLLAKSVVSKLRLH